MGNFGTQPEWIDITFAGLVDCACFPNTGIGPDSYAVTSAIATHFNGNTYRCVSLGGLYPCWFQVTGGDGYGEIKSYMNPACVTYMNTHTLSTMSVNVIFLSATTYRVYIWVVGGSGHNAYAFYADGTFASNNCHDIGTDVLDNLNTDCTRSMCCCEDGTATIAL